MYTILIVDDEKNIRDGLKLIIDWASYDCEVIGDADDGLVGMEKATEIRPDIIISDIKMPNLDGIEMIKALKSMGNQSRFIVLSGYSEFDYAKSAINLGVKSYLLKPIEEDELIRCLNAIIEDIKYEEQQHNEVSLLKKEKLIQADLYKHSILRDIVDGCTDNNEEIMSLFDSISIDVNASDYTCAIISIANDYDINLSNEILRLEKKLNIGSSKITLFLYRKNQIACILYNTPRINNYYYNLHNKIEQQLNVKSSLAIGKPYKYIKDLSKSFYEAQYALSFKLVKGSNSVTTYLEAKNSANSNTLYSPEFWDELRFSVESKSKEKARASINSYFDNLTYKGNPSFMDIKLNCLYYLIPLLQTYPNVKEKLETVTDKDIVSLNSIFHLVNYNDLINWFTNIVNSIIDILASEINNDSSILINQIKSYIQKHYFEEITLSSIAEHYYINPYYLSQLFKTKTGTNYLQYLTKIRLEASKYYLKNSDKKIYEIALEVGYGNSKYFSNLFEKNYGMKPSAYRKN